MAAAPCENMPSTACSNTWKRNGSLMSQRFPQFFLQYMVLRTLVGESFKLRTFDKPEPPLVEAVFSGNRNAVNDLLKRNIDVNVVSSDHETACYSLLLATLSQTRPTFPRFSWKMVLLSIQKWSLVVVEISRLWDLDRFYSKDCSTLKEETTGKTSWICCWCNQLSNTTFTRATEHNLRFWSDWTHQVEICNRGYPKKRALNEHLTESNKSRLLLSHIRVG